MIAPSITGLAARATNALLARQDGRQHRRHLLTVSDCGSFLHFLTKQKRPWGWGPAPEAARGPTPLGRKWSCSAIAATAWHVHTQRTNMGSFLWHISTAGHSCTFYLARPRPACVQVVPGSAACAPDARNTLGALQCRAGQPGRGAQAVRHPPRTHQTYINTKRTRPLLQRTCPWEPGRLPPHWRIAHPENEHHSPVTHPGGAARSPATAAASAMVRSFL